MNIGTDKATVGRRFFLGGVTAVTSILASNSLGAAGEQSLETEMLRWLADLQNSGRLIRRDSGHLAVGVSREQLVKFYHSLAEGFPGFKVDLNDRIQVRSGSESVELRVHT